MIVVMKAVITVKCPECKGTLEIDVVREKVISHKAHVDLEKPEKDKSLIFEDVVHRVKSRETEAEIKFKEAQKSVAESKKRLDDLFGDVKKKIAEEKQKPPQEGPDSSRPEFWD